MKEAVNDQKFGGWFRWIAALAVLGCISISLSAQANKEEEKAKATGSEANSANDVFKLGTNWTVMVEDDLKSSSEQMESSIDKEKIELFEKKDVGQALSRIPGVRFVRPSGGRYESGVYVRGFVAYGNRDGQVPIYIDGIPAYVPYDYTMDMGRFTVGDVSTIHVAKGYSSTLYGPNTLGGVINIVSRRPTKALDGNVTLGMGTGNSSEASGAIGTLQDKWYAQVGLSYFEHKFVHAADNFVGTDDAKTPQAKDTDRMNYRTRDEKVSFKFGYIPNATDEYVISYSKQTGLKGPRAGALGYEITAWEWPNWDRETISIVSTTKLGKFYVKPRIYFDKFDNALWGWGGNDYISFYDDYAASGALEIGTAAIENNILKSVFSYTFDQHKAYENDGRDGPHRINSDSKLEQSLFSFALEDTYKLSSHWELQGGLSFSRRDTTHVALGSNLTGMLSAFPAVSDIINPIINTWDPEGVLFYKPTSKSAFHYSIAKKTRFPSMRNQYSNYGASNTVKNPSTNLQVPLVTLQNPDLKPERVVHHDFGYDGKLFKKLSLQASYFYSRHKNMMDRSAQDFTTYPGYAVQQMTNVAGRITRQGFDLGIDYDLNNKIMLGLSYGYLHSENLDNLVYHFALPAGNGSVYASVRLNDWVSVVPAFDFYGSSYYASSGTYMNNRNSGAVIADLKFTITPPMHKRISINIGANNLFNNDCRGWNEKYPTPGRYTYANLRYTL
jgi:iron complex outermembrane recepter protein